MKYFLSSICFGLLFFSRTFSAVATANQIDPASKSDEIWSQLNSYLPQYSEVLRTNFNNFCALRKLRSETPLNEKRVKNLLTLSDDFRLIELRNLNTSSSNNYFAVFDSDNRQQRIIFYDSSDGAWMELFDVGTIRHWIDIKLSVDMNNCSPRDYILNKQGVNTTDSNSYFLDTLDWIAPQATGPAKLSANPVILSVADQGFNLGHPLLQPYLLRDQEGNLMTLNSTEFAPFPVNDDHGNHVSGIASGQNANIAILPIEAPYLTGYLGSGPGSTLYIPTTSLFESATKQIQTLEMDVVQFAAHHGARVMNFSFGRFYQSPDFSFNRASQGSLDGFERAMQQFSQILFTVAAGNDRSNIDSGTYHPASRRLKNVAVVAAVDSNGHLATFSNYGHNIVDFAAPGTYIESLDAGRATYLPDGSYGWKWGTLSMSGTSMAAPYAANLFAKILVINPNLLPEKVIDLVCSTVTLTAELKTKTRCGGVINEDAALAAAKASL